MQKNIQNMTDKELLDYRYEIEKEISRCHNMQLAKKIQLNSAYGALGNRYFRWFNSSLAESITKSGQLSIRWIEIKINEFLNEKLNTDNIDYVIAVDTDSIYIDMEKYVEKFIDDTDIVTKLDEICCNIIEPYINKCYDDLAVYVNAYAQKMHMKREAIADKGIFTAKKRYILNVHNSEGVKYTEPKLKIMGIEAIRTSTPSVVRDSIKKALKIIMTETEDVLINFIENEREKFSKLSFEDIAFPRGCSELNKWEELGNTQKIYKKGTPIHVKGAIIYNNLLEKYDLTNKYEKIRKGEKVKFCYLKTPNILNEHVISCPGKLPEEFKIDQIIDYEIQFEKSFLEPLKIILNTIGWKTEKRNTLESFFS